MNQDNQRQNTESDKKAAYAIANPLILFGFVLYVLSMFLPAVHMGEPMMRDLKGFECAILGAVAGVLGFMGRSPVDIIWLLMSNLVMFATAGFYLAGKTTPRLNLILLGLGLFIFFASRHPDSLSPESDFYVGYYVWCLSFFVVAGGGMMKQPPRWGVA